jgi:hypothetical protein
MKLEEDMGTFAATAHCVFLANVRIFLPSQESVCLTMDELLKKDVGQDSRFYAMGVSCGQAP